MFAAVGSVCGGETNPAHRAAIGDSLLYVNGKDFMV